tara:strand:+ start:6097 stop:6705 length:609 start_codon:yes stop_codon:yes gene_type:complete
MNNDEKNMKMLKIIVLGDTEVGKSSYIKLCKYGHFNNVQTTIGVDFETITLDFGDKEIKLKIWDTAGQERFRSIIERFYKNVDGVLIFFDCTNINSIDNVEYWINDVKKKVSDDIPITIVANKWQSLDDTIYEKHLKNFTPFVKIDNLHKLNVKEPLHDLIQKICERQGCRNFLESSSTDLSIFSFKNLKEKYPTKMCCNIS